MKKEIRILLIITCILILILSFSFPEEKETGFTGKKGACSVTAPIDKADF